MCSSSVRLSSRPVLARSIAWPPAMPRDPAAAASARTMSSWPPAWARSAARPDLERQALQGVPDQQRGGLAEGDVAGRLAAAQHVVVHARQVVVHQRVGVDQLYRSSGTLDLVRLRTGGLSRGECEQRAHPLAATQHRIAHGLMQAERRQARRRQQPFQHGLHALLAQAHPVGEVSRLGLHPRSPAATRLRESGPAAGRPSAPTGRTGAAARHACTRPGPLRAATRPTPCARRSLPARPAQLRSWTARTPHRQAAALSGATAGSVEGADCLGIGMGPGARMRAAPEKRMQNNAISMLWSTRAGRLKRALRPPQRWLKIAPPLPTGRTAI